MTILPLSERASLGLLIAAAPLLGAAMAPIAAEPASASVRQAAERGDPTAQRRLAQVYEHGTAGLPADPALAESWYRKAADGGNLEAISRYGRLLFTRDRAGALPWLVRAADRGEPKAAYIAGTALFNGDGGRKDWTTAWAYMRLAADAGVAPAVTSLAQMTPLLSTQQMSEAKARLAGLQQAARAVVTSRHVVGAKPPAPHAVPTDNAAKPMMAKSPAATPSAIGSGPYYAQLGAFGSPASARDAWRRLGTSLHAFAGGRAPTLMPAGAVTRLRVVHLDANGAEWLCRTVIARGGKCFTGREVGSAKP